MGRRQSIPRMSWKSSFPMWRRSGLLVETMGILLVWLVSTDLGSLLGPF